MHANVSAHLPPNAQAKLTGAARKDVEARKTTMAAPVSFSRWLAAEFGPLV
jgi:hypothetical protein